jgi:hypothetical protein
MSRGTALTMASLQKSLNCELLCNWFTKNKYFVMIPRAEELTPPSLRTFDMISIYSTILCAVSRKKQVTTASHAAGTTYRFKTKGVR